MLKQYVQGLTPKTLQFSAGSDETALISIMAGKVDTYEQKSTGGSALSVHPAELNKKQFIVGKKSATGRFSAMVRVPHVKAAFYFNNIVTATKGVFDAGYDTTEKCDYVKMNFDKLA